MNIEAFFRSGAKPSLRAAANQCVPSKPLRLHPGSQFSQPATTCLAVVDANNAQRGNLSLSDLIPFQSSLVEEPPVLERHETPLGGSPGEDDWLIPSADVSFPTKLQSRPIPDPASSPFSLSGDLGWREQEEQLQQQEATRAALAAALAESQASKNGSTASSGVEKSEKSVGLGGGSMPSPSTSTDGPRLQLAQAPAAPSRSPWASSPMFVELEEDGAIPRFLEMVSEEALLVEKASGIELPPMESVRQLTRAYMPPMRDGQVVEEVADSPAAQVFGRSMGDGIGQLEDGTKYQKKSGEEFGPDGYWKRWTTLRGITEGTEWEESWWECSDRTGLKELGAHKWGRTAEGAAWREEWSEKMYHDKTTLGLVIERTAHKWAKEAGGNEWEEQWGESYARTGRVIKSADKWAKQGDEVWHEKWGEDYDGHGACLKYTDKWAERALPGGAREQWGDKWTENFGGGKGSKHGEVWSVGANGESYNRWWNEEHLGERRVRKYGNSTANEYWDTVEEMDTYYNPVPHFGFQLALQHSPQLRNVPILPMGGDEESSELSLGTGMHEF